MEPTLLPRRRAFKSVLIWAEGLNDAAFVKHLRMLFGSDEYRFSIRQGGGGSPLHLVQKCVNFEGDYAIRVVFLDNDSPSVIMTDARNLAEERNIICIENTPCLEATMLAILSQPVPNTSSQCKREFENNHITRRNRRETKYYVDVFPKRLLTSARQQIDPLNAILNILEGGVTE